MGPVADGILQVVRISILLLLVVTTLSSFSSMYVTNANPSLDYQYTPSSPIVLSSPTSQYTINLYDHDDVDADDWMGGVYFTPYNSANGFPSTLILAPSGGSTSFRLEVVKTSSS